MVRESIERDELPGRIFVRPLMLSTTILTMSACVAASAGAFVSFFELRRSTAELVTVGPEEAKRIDRLISKFEEYVELSSKNSAKVDAATAQLKDISSQLDVLRRDIALSHLKAEELEKKLDQTLQAVSKQIE